jgi:transposase
MAAGGVTSRDVYVSAPEEDSLIRYHVGIDVGKSKHHACVRDSMEDRYTKVFPFTVDRQDFERFLLFLRRQGPVEEILVGVEASGPYALTIGHFLLEHGYAVVEINPFQANQFRKAQGKKAKTDRVDARSLAAFLSVGSYKPLALGDPRLENLRELTRFRVDLVKDRTCQVNRLQETLAIAFPELGAHLASLDSPSALTLLAAYPSPQALAEAGTPAVSACLIETSHHRLGSVQAQAIVSAAGTTIGLLRRQPALALKLEVLVQVILNVNMQLQRVEAAIVELFSHLPYDKSDFPVGSIQSLAGILAEVDDVNRFPTLKQFLSHFGWCPQTFQTGGFSQEHPRMSHAGNRYMRRMIWLLAIMAVKTVPAYRAYMQRRTAAGKKKMHTVVAVGRKLLSFIYALLKTGTPYSPEGGAENNSHCPALTSL